MRTRDWIDEAAEHVEEVRTWFPRLDGTFTTASFDTGGGGNRSPLPFDPRPADLRRDVQEFAEDRATEVRETLGLHTQMHQTTQTRLQFLRHALRATDAADPELAARIDRTALELTRRYKRLTDPIGTRDPYPLTVSCPTTGCGEASLWVNPQEPRVWCQACFTVWSPEDLLHLALRG